MRITQLLTIKIYISASGKQPFTEWLENLDRKVRYRIKHRLDRIACGNLGDFKIIGNGVYELRFNFGAGYRIYFGQDRIT